MHINPKQLKAGLIGIALIALSVSAVHAGKDAEKIVRKVHEKYQKLKTLRVDFVQSIYWSLAEEEQQVEGTLYLADGNRYRVETDNQIIVTDGQTVWTYSKDRNQVIINDLSASKENPLPRDLLLKYTHDFNARLIGETRFNGRPCYEIEFIPKAEEDFIVRTRIWVDKKRWLALKIEQEDINENITRYVLKNFQIDRPLDENLFTFEIAKDMEVIDLR